MENGENIFPSAPVRNSNELENFASTIMPEITQEWVEKNIIPHLRSLSRNGVLILFDSGVEPLTRGGTT